MTAPKHRIKVGRVDSAPTTRTSTSPPNAAPSMEPSRRRTLADQNINYAASGIPQPASAMKKTSTLGGGARASINSRMSMAPGGATSGRSLVAPGGSQGAAAPTAAWGSQSSQPSSSAPATNSRLSMAPRGGEAPVAPGTAGRVQLPSVQSGGRADGGSYGGGRQSMGGRYAQQAPPS